LQRAACLCVLGFFLCTPPASSGANEPREAPAAEAEGEDEAGLLADEFAFLQEEDVVVSAAKHRQRTGFSPSAVIVITRKDIEESGVTSFTELLRLYPALHVYMFDPLWPTAEVRSTNRILLLLDSRAVNLELFESPFFTGIPIGLHEIDRVEIVLGPNSSLYGADAVAAVINVVTRPLADETHADFSLLAGSHGGLAAEGLLGSGLGPLRFRGSFGIEQAQSWTDREMLALNMIRANGTARLQLESGSLTLNGGLSDGQGRFFAHVGYLNCDRVLLGHLKADLHLGKLKVLAYWYALRTTFDVDIRLIYLDLEMGRFPTVDLAGDTAHVEAQYELEPFEDNLLIAGADFRLTNYRSDQLVDPDLWEYRAGAFLHDEHRFGERWLVTVGIRFDWNSKTEPALSPRGAVVFNPAGEHFLRLSGGTAFRKPSLMETSTNFKVDESAAFPEIDTIFEKRGLGNPDLQNEVITAVELGYRGSVLQGSLRLGSNLYLCLFQDNISFSTDIHIDETPMGPRIDVEGSRVGYENWGADYAVLGASLDVEVEPSDELTLFLRGELRHAWLTGSGERKRDIPRLLSSAGGILRLPSGLVLHLALAFASGREDTIGDPRSILLPSQRCDIPDRLYLISALVYSLSLGKPLLDLGLSAFNPFGGRFREEAGVLDSHASNYGGELLGRRVMLTARFRY
jgi:outer membrane receptor protein involved in Fe transport